MYPFLCNFITDLAGFFIMLCFYAKLAFKTFKPFTALIYSGIWFGFYKIVPSQFYLFFAAFLLLFLYGIFCCKINWKYTFLLSVLLLSISLWASGVAEAVGYWTAKVIGSKYIQILQFLDFGIACLFCGLLYLSLFEISKLPFKNLRHIHHQILLIAAFPFLFVLLTEQAISSSIYGDTIIWSYDKGLIYPQIQTAPVLLLQLFAGLTFFSILFLFCRLEKTVSVEQQNSLLAHQLMGQKGYIQEIHRYEQQLNSIQHDIKNHFLLLQQLLNQQKIKEAASYLEELSKFSTPLEYPVFTGNPTVDILLKSKLSVIALKDVKIECDLKIPSVSPVANIEWCIILGNAIDNALKALEAVPKNQKYLHITGIGKGDFLYLHIENSCLKALLSIDEGVGLSNIRTVVKKHFGTLDIEIGGGKFSLDILLLISQQ